MPDEPELEPEPESTPPSSGPPDAILFPASWKPAGTPHQQAKALAERLGPILGGVAHWVDVPGDMKLASLDPGVTLLFAKNHPLAGQPRYEWQDRPDGSRYGTLVEAARAEGGA